MLRAVLLVVVAACSGAPASHEPPVATGRGSSAPPPASAGSEARSEGDACTRDADCVVTNFAGCCACPQCAVGEATARSREAQTRAEEKCQLVRCNLHRCQGEVACPPAEDAALFEPKCRDAKCVGVRR